MSTTIEHHGTVAPAADILRYLLGRPRTQQRVVRSPREREALRRLRDSGAIMSCQSLVASLFALGPRWSELAQAVRDDLDSDPDRATMGFVAPDQAMQPGRRTCTAVSGSHDARGGRARRSGL